MSYRVGVQSRIFRDFSLARRLLTDRLTPPPPPRAYISISDNASVRPPAPTSRLTAVARSPRAISSVTAWRTLAAGARATRRRRRPTRAAEGEYPCRQPHSPHGGWV